MPPTLFIHVPKTAGTSFNEAAERQFGLEAMEKDYGADAKHTSALVRAYMYDRTPADQYGFFSAFSAAGKAWLTGHFDADRYLPLFGCQHAIAFVRDPVERVISEYLYRVRQFGMDRSLEDYYRDPGETNKQYRMIGQYPWQAFWCVGTQERYGEAVEHLQEALGLPLDPVVSNARSDNKHADISDEVRADIARWNQRDIAFYEVAASYFDAVLSTAAAGQPFCHHDIGFEPGKHAIGWAFFRGHEGPVELGLYADGALIGTTWAAEHVPALQLVRAPREGHVGFRFVLEPLKDVERIEIKALHTGQTLLQWPAAPPASS